jgi:hypothetical protein
MYVCMHIKEEVREDYACIRKISLCMHVCDHTSASSGAGPMELSLCGVSICGSVVLIIMYICMYQDRTCV